MGVLPIEQALAMAREKNLDLIEIVSTLQPPIVKIYDFGKFLYQKEKEERKQRAKQRTDEMKSVRLTFGIGKHDLEFKARQAEEFLEEYTKVQILRESGMSVLAQANRAPQSVLQLLRG